MKAFLPCLLLLFLSLGLLVCLFTSLSLSVKLSFPVGLCHLSCLSFLYLFFFLYKLSQLGIILDLQENCKDNTENACKSYTQPPFMYPSYIYQNSEINPGTLLLCRLQNQCIFYQFFHQGPTYFQAPIQDLNQHLASFSVYLPFQVLFFFPK